MGPVALPRAREVDEIKALKVLWYPCQGMDNSLVRKKEKKLKKKKKRRMKNSLLSCKQAGNERTERETALSSLK